MPPKKAPGWECGRCYWLQHQAEAGEEVPDHSPHCRWRGTEQDPPVLRLVVDNSR